MSNQNPPRQPASPFERWLEAARTRQIEEIKLVAAGLTYETLEAARSIGLSLLPPEKTTPAHVIEIAKIIFEVENSLREPIDDEPAGDEEEK